MLFRSEETYIPVNEDEFPSDAEVKTPTITLNSDNGWSGTWAKLYKYENGNEIQYKVTENLPEICREHIHLRIESQKLQLQEILQHLHSPILIQLIQQSLQL